MLKVGLSDVHLEPKGVVRENSTTLSSFIPQEGRAHDKQINILKVHSSTLLIGNIVIEPWVKDLKVIWSLHSG